MGMIKLLGILLVLFAYTVIPQTAEGPCRGCKNCQDCGDSCKNCTNCRQYFTITRTCTIAMVIGAGVGGPFIPFILGFGGASVTAGSLAALWQSTMGGVVVKAGIISFLQAIGAAGLGYPGMFDAADTASNAMYMFCQGLESLTGMDMTSPWQINCE